MQIALPPRINIYSVPRSVVINRKAAGEILLSLSLGVPSRSPTLRSAGPVRIDVSLAHKLCVCEETLAHEYVCVSVLSGCVCVCGWGNAGRSGGGSSGAQYQESTNVMSALGDSIFSWRLLM